MRRKGLRIANVAACVALGITLGLVALGAADEGFLSYEEALRAAEEKESVVALLFGNPHCPYTDPARKALTKVWLTGDLRDSMALGYVDITSEQGRPLAKEYHITSTPIAVFLAADRRELWRQVAPGDPTAAAALFREVLDGTRTWRALEARLEEGSLSGKERLLLARAYTERGDHDASIRVLRGVVENRSYARDLRREASLRLALLLDGPKGTAALRRHLEAFPDDLVAKVNLGFAFIRAKANADETRALILETLPAVRASEADYDRSLVISAYRLAHDFAVSCHTSFAATALPYVERALELDPSDGGMLTEVVTLSILAGQPERIPVAADRVRRHDQQTHPSMSKERAQRVEDFIESAIQEGRRVADYVTNEYCQRRTPSASLEGVAAADDHIALKFENAPITTILEALSRAAGLELVLRDADLHSMRASVAWEDVPIKQALAELAEQHSLAYVVKGGRVLEVRVLQKVGG